MLSTHAVADRETLCSEHFPLQYIDIDVAIAMTCPKQPAVQHVGFVDDAVETIRPKHRADLIKRGDFSPSNWIHGRVNPKYDGLTTAAITSYGRICASPNKDFYTYYYRGSTIQPNGNRRNYSAVCDPPCTPYLKPEVVFKGPMPSTARNNKYYFDEHGQSRYPHIIGSGPTSIPACKLVQIGWAMAKPYHEAKSYDPTLGPMQDSEGSKWRLPKEYWDWTEFRGVKRIISV